MQNIELDLLPEMKPGRDIEEACMMPQSSSSSETSDSCEARRALRCASRAIAVCLRRTVRGIPWRQNRLLDLDASGGNADAGRVCICNSVSGFCSCAFAASYPCSDQSGSAQRGAFICDAERNRDVRSRSSRDGATVGLQIIARRQGEQALSELMLGKLT
eukprot:CAMPEP_0169304512 /NCGR_PEP_ID=MMETSP1016-20121227/69921_1 /TAXON_ID=342587 /ORGANISM="Karlodinium micrum, Strain CCMP2283" /LENGTH=159 /DNA_ID=CAMNT_0009397391 /DNA_START=121 /DNA_END=598 /DNA_ORIENTATION=+